MMIDSSKLNDRFFFFSPALLIRVAAYALLWTVLTGGRLESWLLGVPAVLAAAWAAGGTRRFRSGRFSFPGALLFTGFFLKASLISGFDVVRRALHPKLLLRPDLIEYRLSLGSDMARIFMTDAVSLLPGTLSADLANANLTIHVLDKNSPIRADLTALEKRVAAMLEADGRPPHSEHGETR